MRDQKLHTLEHRLRFVAQFIKRWSENIINKNIINTELCFNI